MEKEGAGVKLWKVLATPAEKFTLRLAAIHRVDPHPQPRTRTRIGLGSRARYPPQASIDYHHRISYTLPSQYTQSLCSQGQSHQTTRHVPIRRGRNAIHGHRAICQLEARRAVRIAQLHEEGKWK